jgi:hypothetical protein
MSMGGMSKSALDRVGAALQGRGKREHGSPVHAWFFFTGFVVPVVWWLASFWRVPTTRSVGGTDLEKAIVVDAAERRF